MNKKPAAAHILVVDDEHSFRSTLYLILSSRGYRVSQAANGREGMELLREMHQAGSAPDLVLTDLKMPEMDGLEFMETIQRENIPVQVAVATGYGDRDMVRKLELMGCSWILNKPFDADELFLLLNEIFQENGG